MHLVLFSKYSVLISVLSVVISLSSAILVLYRTGMEVELARAQINSIEAELSSASNRLDNLDASTNKILNETDVIRLSSDLDALRKLRPIVAVLPKVNNTFVKDGDGIYFQHNEHVVTNLGAFEISLREVSVSYLCDDNLLKRMLTGDSMLIPAGYSLSVYPERFRFPDTCSKMIVSVTAVSEPDSLLRKLLSSRYESLLSDFEAYLKQEYTYNNRYTQ